MNASAFKEAENIDYLITNVEGKTDIPQQIENNLIINLRKEKQVSNEPKLESELMVF
jgi:hypothetical protein